MNSLYSSQTRGTLASLLAVLSIITTLYLVAMVARFLSSTLESGLDATTLVQFIFFQAPIQISALLPISLFAACITSSHRIFEAKEYQVLRAAGVFQSSFFRPYQLVGLIVFIIQAAFVSEIAPWANRNLDHVKEESSKQAAYNTLINSGEPVYIGDLEVYAERASGNSLENVSLLGHNENGSTTLIHGMKSEFIADEDAVSLAIQGGRILSSRQETPILIQNFEYLLLDFDALFEKPEKPLERHGLSGKSLIDLLADSENNYPNEVELGRRLASLVIVLIMPSWIALWYIKTPENRTSKLRLYLIGPISLIPMFIFLETPALYAGKSLGVLISTLLALLSLGFIGPMYFWLERLLTKASRPFYQGHA